MSSLASLRLIAETFPDAGLDPQCQIDTDEHPGPLQLIGFGEDSHETIFLAPAAADQAHTFTAASALVLVSDQPFSLRLASGESLLTNLRMFVLWADDSANAAHSTRVLLTGNGDNTAKIKVLTIEQT